MNAFLSHWLFLLAAWTLVVKFAFPVAYALGTGAPAGAFVMWDFWWAVHLWLGLALLRWRHYTFALAVGVAAIEIVIVAVKFVLFLDAPVWTIWTANWFVNKLFVLACFVTMAAWLALHWRRLRALPAGARP